MHLQVEERGQWIASWQQRVNFWFLWGACERITSSGRGFWFALQNSTSAPICVRRDALPRRFTPAFEKQLISFCDLTEVSLEPPRLRVQHDGHAFTQRHQRQRRRQKLFQKGELHFYHFNKELAFFRKAWWNSPSEQLCCCVNITKITASSRFSLITTELDGV